jgi:hypothetical protein
MITKRLPKIVYIEKLIKVLDLVESNQHTDIEDIIQQSMEHNLPLYFRKPVTGISLDTEFDMLYTDEDFNGVPIQQPWPPRGTIRTEFNDGEETSIHNATVIIDGKECRTKISVSEFTCEGKSFFHMPKHSNIHEPLILELDEVFCKRDDVILCLETEKPLTHVHTTKSKTEKETKPEERNRLFKNWLDTKTEKMRLPNNATYQDKYHSLNIQSKAKLLASLQHTYPKAFIGKCVIFLNSKEVVNFKKAIEHRQNTRL